MKHPLSRKVRPHKTPPNESSQKNIAKKEKRPDPISKFVGRTVVIQTRSPSQFTGHLNEYSCGALLLVQCVESRWNNDGTDLVVIQKYEGVSIDRAAVQFIGFIANQDGGQQ